MAFSRGSTARGSNWPSNFYLSSDVREPLRVQRIPERVRELKIDNTLHPRPAAVSKAELQAIAAQANADFERRRHANHAERVRERELRIDAQEVFAERRAYQRQQYRKLLSFD
jgi:hypothetical protein